MGRVCCKINQLTTVPFLFQDLVVLHRLKSFPFAMSGRTSWCKLWWQWISQSLRRGKLVEPLITEVSTRHLSGILSTWVRKAKIRKCSLPLLQPKMLGQEPLLTLQACQRVVPQMANLQVLLVTQQKTHQRLAVMPPMGSRNSWLLYNRSKPAKCGYILAMLSFRRRRARKTRCLLHRRCLFVPCLYKSHVLRVPPATRIKRPCRRSQPQRSHVTRPRHLSLDLTGHEHGQLRRSEYFNVLLIPCYSRLAQTLGRGRSGSDPPPGGGSCYSYLQSMFHRKAIVLDSYVLTCTGMASLIP